MGKTAQTSSGILRFAFTRRVFRRNLLIALSVGCLLSLTNQLDLILRGQFGTRLAIKTFFNFLIPFVVSSVSAIINRERFWVGQISDRSQEAPR